MLTQDDYYEIEKTLDIYASWIGDKIEHYYNSMINGNERKALIGEKGITENPLIKSIKELEFTRQRIKEIRTKLEDMREYNYFQYFTNLIL